MNTQASLPLAISTGTSNLSPDEAVVHDALCFVQGPAAIAQLMGLLAATGLCTRRGTGFHAQEVHKLIDSLVSSRLARVETGRWQAAPATGWQRFRELVENDKLRDLWWRAWKADKRFEQGWSLDIRDEATLAGAMRVVIFAGRTQPAFDRLCKTAIGIAAHGHAALRRALLAPFDGKLLGQLEPKFSMALAASLLNHLGGSAEADERPLLEWLLLRSRTPKGVSDSLRYRLAEWLIFCRRGDEARPLLAAIREPESRALEAVADIAEGRFEAGATAFEAAWKALAAEVGRRKNLLPDSINWAYAMALLASPEPAAWTKARKFAASEGGKRDAHPGTFWGVWQEAVDQRIGDAPRNPKFYVITAPAQPGFVTPHALQQLHHLLLAAWLGFAPQPAGAVRQHGAHLAQRYDNAGQHWLAGLARKATAQLAGEPPSESDATLPFFVGPSQDRWREALNSILALGGAAPGAKRAPAAAGDRLLWTVRIDEGGRIHSIEPWEQKGGPRGYGKPKEASLVALLKRSALPEHDTALLRAVTRERYSQRAVLNLSQAAVALVRHPHVAWANEPLAFIEVVEALPALEVMTKGEHIHFRVLDPIRPPGGDEDEDDDDDEFFALTPRERQLLKQHQQVLLLPDGPSRARLLRITPGQLRVAELVTQGWQVPVSAKDELDAALRVLAAHFQLASDAETGTDVVASNVLRAELTPQGSGVALRLVAAPFGDFGPRLAPGAGRERATTVHRGVTFSTRRDLAAERANLLALTHAVDFLDDGAHAWQLDEPDQALALVEALAALEPRILSEWPKGRPLRVRKVAAQQVKVAVASRGDWLDLDGDVTFDDGEVLRLGRLLELLGEGRSRFVALGDGGFLALSDTLRQQLADLRSLAQPQGKGGQRLSNVAAAAWSAHAGNLALVGDAAWQKRSDSWTQAQARSFEPPSALQAELRDYQRDGYRWLMRLAASGFGACLADDMGLGKTLQTLAVLIERASGGAALVVAPTSVCGNWLAEAARFAPGLEVALYGAGVEAVEATDEEADERTNTGDASDEPANLVETTAREPADERNSARRAARRRQVAALGAGQVLVCSYALLQIDADILTERVWHTAVLDEAQAIKNAATRRARASQALQADLRLALTGTPIENRLGELWSIMSFANPGLLGSAEQFNQRFAGPIERGGDAQAAKRLRRLVAPFLLRRTKAEVLSDLPPRTEIVHEVVPGPRERALLEALRREAQASVNQALAKGAAPGQAQIHMLAALTKLRRAACDPRLVAPELAQPGAKVQEFERLAQELVAGRHKALVFSQFTDFLALLRERLDLTGLSYQYLDGSTPAAERTKRVAAFQAGSGDFFLISLKAGGFGLNLTMADYVIITDPWWNPAAEDQASGRAHRIGQQRPVTVYRLVTQGSIEDRIVRLHRSKRELAEGILSGQDGGGRAMGASELMELLRGEG